MISGTTRVCFVAADPVAQLRTPHALNLAWEAQRRDAVAVPAHVSAAGLADFASGIRANASALGAVMTVPHKQRAADLCDELGPHAEIVGAVNVIRRTRDGRLIGETFDGLGFVAGLVAAGIAPAGRRVVLLGAGGAASAIAVALLRADVRRLDIANRTQQRADELVRRLRGAFPSADLGAGLDRVSHADLVINATSAGLHASDASPLDGRLLPKAAIAADVVMSAGPTPFLAAAAANGIATHAGTHMLTGQIQLISEYLANPDLAGAAHAT